MPSPVTRLTRLAAPAPHAWMSAYASGTDVTALNSSLADNAVIRMPDRVLSGPAAVMADAMALRATLQDCRVLGEDAISIETLPGAGDGDIGTALSTRATLSARHDGDGIWGAATGKPVQMRVLTDCWKSDGQVRDAWVIRDTAGLLKQIGVQDLRSWLETRLNTPSRLPPRPDVLGPENDPEPAYIGTGVRTPEADSLAETVKSILGGELSVVARKYEEGCESHFPGSPPAIGRDAVESFWTGLRSAFPGASFRIEHRLGQVANSGPAVATLRWSLYGRHEGFGRFGAPTGAYAYVLGLTQVEFGASGIRREWTLIDDLAIWTQLLSPPAPT